MIVLPSSQPTPDIGDIVYYKGKTWRVSAWMKVVHKKKLMKTDYFISDTMPKSFGDLISDILIESATNPKGFVRMWCSREEATLLCGVGICGCTIPVKECIIVGKVKWSEERIAESKQSAERLIGTIST